MKEFSDKRADKAFIGVAKAIADFRNENAEYTNEEMAYAILQTCCCIDEGNAWFEFISEALSECINQEAHDA